MLSLISILNLFFILLISYQIFLGYYKPPIVEGLLDLVPTIAPAFTPTVAPKNELMPNLTINQVYRQYDKKIADNTFLLAQQNAGNIEVLRQQSSNVPQLTLDVTNLTKRVGTVEDQITQLVSAQKAYADNLTGGSPPDVTGT
jgi:hypothetical protein